MRPDVQMILCLSSRGLSHRQVARRLRVSTRVVQRAMGRHSQQVERAEEQYRPRDLGRIRNSNGVTHDTTLTYGVLLGKIERDETGVALRNTDGSLAWRWHGTRTVREARGASRL